MTNRVRHLYFLPNGVPADDRTPLCQITMPDRGEGRFEISDGDRDCLLCTVLAQAQNVIWDVGDK